MLNSESAMCCCRHNVWNMGQGIVLQQLVVQQPFWTPLWSLPGSVALVLFTQLFRDHTLSWYALFMVWSFCRYSAMITLFRIPEHQHHLFSTGWHGLEFFGLRWLWAFPVRAMRCCLWVKVMNSSWIWSYSMYQEVILVLVKFVQKLSTHLDASAFLVC